MNYLITFPYRCENCKCVLDVNKVKYESVMIDEGSIYKQPVCGNCYTEIEHVVIPNVEAEMRKATSTEERDMLIEGFWKAFKKVRVNEAENTLEPPFLGFFYASDIEVIHEWINKRHSKGIEYLLTGEDTGRRNDQYIYYI